MRYRVFAIVLLAVLTSTLSGMGHAQEKRDRAEARQDRRELRQDRREMRDDRDDVARLESILVEFDQAVAANDRPALDRIDAQLREILGDEMSESKRELAKDEAEVRRGRRELRSDRRELKQNRRQDAPRAQRADDRRDLRDDRRDLRDDRRDAGVESASVQGRRRLAHGLSELEGKHDASSLRMKRRLIVKLTSMARAELGQDGAERREDRRELREDRRERREHKRQG